MGKERSMTSVITMMQVLLFSMAAAVITVMAFGIAVQNHLQVRFMDRLEVSDRILEDLYVMEQDFREFGHEWGEESYSVYKEQVKQLENDLAEFREMSKDSSQTQNYIRRLNNFNIYQMEQIDSAMIELKERYHTYLYVLSGLDGHQEEALAMARGDMAYAKAEYETGAETMARGMLIVALAFGLSVALTAVALTRFSAVTRLALNHMTEYFNHLASSEWETPDLKETAYRELTLITQTANRMKEKIKQSIEEIQNQAMLEKQLAEEKLVNEQQRSMVVAAQMAALRAQVNPHFLFNSLNTIGVTALVGDSKMVMQMVEATGKILRYSLYHQELMTNLDDELDVVLQYLFLQKCRFGEAVRSEIQNDFEGEEIEIPTMSIQPIVENCFKHGFGNKEKLNIHITITQEDNSILISVMDDGIGFDTEQKKPGGIGLENIRKRLELLYGKEESWLQVESVVGEYTCVSLKIPQKGETDEGSHC